MALIALHLQRAPDVGMTLWKEWYLNMDVNIEKLQNWTFCWGPWVLTCYHIFCQASPIFLKKGRSAESLLHGSTAHAESVISPSTLYYPSSDFIVSYPFNSIATACGCQWGEGASLHLGDWLCSLCAGAAAAPFPPATALLLPWPGGARGDIRQSEREQWMSQAVFHPARCTSGCLMPVCARYLASSVEQYLSLHWLSGRR